jgi:hypothetical protein
MQALLMVLIVVAAAVYAAWYWMPAAWRVRLGRVHGSLAAAPACGSCESSCGGCSKVAGDADAASPSARVIPIAVDRGPARSDAHR